MVKITEMVHFLSVKHSDRINKICKPMYSYFGVNGFFMSKSYNNGKFFSIGSNLAYHECYYLENHYLSSPFSRDPKYITQGIYTYRQIRDDTYQKEISKALEKTQTEPLIGIAIKNQNSLTRFGYCGNGKIEREQIIHFLSSNIPLLCKFQEYFVNEMEPKLKIAEEYSINLPEVIGKDYYKVPVKPYLKVPDLDARLKFLNQIGIISTNVRITKREYDCLEHIAMGLTSEMIGHKMNLSKRTVENYIEGIKHKFNCNSKSELISIARLL